MREHFKIAALVESLHDGCWAAHGDLSTAVLCSRGVRQGCESEPTIFNSSYQLATDAVKDRLREDGIFMTLPAPSGELWDGVLAAGQRSAHGQSGELHGTEEILDVYFVDDGCYMIAHKQAAELVGRMRVLGDDRLDLLEISAVSEHGQRKDRGHVGTSVQECGDREREREKKKLRCAVGFWLDIDDDERQVHCKVHVVSENKHLGTWVSLRSRCMRDAQQKEEHAMASYSPLAVKVLGNSWIRTWLRMAPIRSLVLSRSCFNLHISVPHPWLLKRLKQSAHARLETHNWMHQWDQHRWREINFNRTGL